MGNEEANAGTTYAVRRSVPRYSLIASVEVIEPANDVRLSGRISEISRKGCYIDMLNTLPMGTQIIVRVSRDKGTFETRGKVIYAQDSMGMGIAFVDPSEEQLRTLDTWLEELSV